MIWYHNHVDSVFAECFATKSYSREASSFENKDKLFSIIWYPAFIWLPGTKSPRHSTNTPHCTERGGMIKLFSNDLAFFLTAYGFPSRTGSRTGSHLPSRSKELRWELWSIWWERVPSCITILYDIDKWCTLDTLYYSWFFSGRAV